MTDPSLSLVLLALALAAYHVWRVGEAFARAMLGAPACPGCGHDVAADDRYCERCGRALG